MELDKVKDTVKVSNSFIVNLALANLFDEIEIFGLECVINGECKDIIVKDYWGECL